MADRRRGTQALPAGTRVRVRPSCVWPERVGCEGVVVAPRADGIYPQPGPRELLVLLDDDPLDTPEGRAAPFGQTDEWWSCCMSRDDVDVVGS